MSILKQEGDTLRDVALGIICEELMFVGLSVMEKIRQQQLTNIALEMPMAAPAEMEKLREVYNEKNSLSLGSASIDKIQQVLGNHALYSATHAMRKAVETKATNGKPLL